MRHYHVYDREKRQWLTPAGSEVEWTKNFEMAAKFDRYQDASQAANRRPESKRLQVTASGELD